MPLPNVILSVYLNQYFLVDMQGIFVSKIGYGFRIFRCGPNQSKRFKSSACYTILRIDQAYVAAR